jgi:uncharacterized membrane protein (DUF2068 family)
MKFMVKSLALQTLNKIHDCNLTINTHVRSRRLVIPLSALRRRTGRGDSYFHRPENVRQISAPAATHLPWTHLKSTNKKHPHHEKIAWLIGGAKIFYGLLLLGVGIGALNLIGKNLATELWHLTERWNIDFHSHYVQILFREADEIDGEKFLLLTVAAFGYAALFFVEGVGLILGKYWAQWLVIVDTASFIPSEIYYLARQFSWFNLVLLLVNAAVVIYLVWQVMTHKHLHKSSGHKVHK